MFTFVAVIDIPVGAVVLTVPPESENQSIVGVVPSAMLFVVIK